MAYGEIQVEMDGPVVTVALNRPEKRNALSLNLMKEMVDCLSAIGRVEKAKVVVLRGNGPVFSAGHDIREMAAGDLQAYRTTFATCMESIIIPDTAKEKPQEGRVVAVGPGRNEEGKVIPLGVKTGDKILFRKYSGTEINGEDHLIMREEDIVGVIE